MGGWRWSVWKKGNERMGCLNIDQKPCIDCILEKCILSEKGKGKPDSQRPIKRLTKYKRLSKSVIMKNKN